MINPVCEGEREWKELWLKIKEALLLALPITLIVYGLALPVEETAGEE